MLCWGSVPVFLRSFIEEIDAWTANGFRYPFAALVWTIPLIIWVVHKKVPAWCLGWALVPTFFNIFNQTFWGWAPYHLEPGMISFIARTSLVFSITISFIVFRDERALLRSRTFWVGLTLCVAGFLGINVMGGELTSQATWVGVLIVLGHSLFASLYGVSVRKLMRGIAPWVSFPIICWYTSIIMLWMMFAFGEPANLFTLSQNEFLLLALSSLIGIGLGHVSFYYSIQSIGVSISSGCILLMPFYTSVISYFVYGEYFSLPQWISGTLMVAGAGILLWAQQDLGKAKEPAVSTPDRPAEPAELALETRS